MGNKKTEGDLTVTPRFRAIRAPIRRIVHNNDKEMTLEFREISAKELIILLIIIDLYNLLITSY